MLSPLLHCKHHSQVEQRRLQSACLYRLTKQQFKQALSASTAVRTTPPNVSDQRLVKSPRTDLRASQSSTSKISLLDYNFRYQLVADQQSSNGCPWYKFVQMHNPEKAKIISASSCSSKAESDSRKTLNVGKDDSPTQEQTAAALPPVATPHIMVGDISTVLPSDDFERADQEFPAFTLQISSPSIKVSPSAADVVKHESRGSHINRHNQSLHPHRMTARPSSARSNASRRSTRSKKSCTMKEKHWVDNLTISDAIDQYPLPRRKNKGKNSKGRASKGPAVDSTRPPSFICPSSQEKSHQYRCCMWVLHTNFHCSLKSLPLP